MPLPKIFLSQASSGMANENGANTRKHLAGHKSKASTTHFHVENHSAALICLDYLWRDEHHKCAGSVATWDKRGFINARQLCHQQRKGIGRDDSVDQCLTKDA